MLRSLNIPARTEGSLGFDRAGATPSEWLPGAVVRQPRDKIYGNWTFSRFLQVTTSFGTLGLDQESRMVAGPVDW